MPIHDTLTWHRKFLDAGITEIRDRAVVCVALETLAGSPTPDHQLGEAAQGMLEVECLGGRQGWISARGAKRQEVEDHGHDAHQD